MRTCKAGACAPPRTAAVLTILAVLALSCLGCGGQPNRTARGAATAFVNFMKAGKYKEAALLWDYEQYARRENPDWDTFGPSQRRLIIDKLANDKAATLQFWSSHFVGDVKVAEVAEEGETAKATIEGGGISTLDLVKSGDAWHITGIN